MLLILITAKEEEEEEDGGNPIGPFITGGGTGINTSPRGS